MKSILLSVPYDSFFLPILRKKFKKRGYKIFYYDYRYGDKLAKFLSSFFGKKIAKVYINIRIFQIVKRCNPNFLITVKGENISACLLKRLKKTPTKTVNWFPDPMNYWQVIKKIAPHYDYFFHFDPLVVRKLKKEGVENIRYLPFASEAFAKREQKKYDISFVGTYNVRREKNLLLLTKFRLNIWGDEKWHQSKLKEFIRGNRVSPSKMHKIIKQSKININFHHQTTKEGTNLRTFQVTGCRAFLLAEYVKDLNNLFEIGKEIVCFKNSQELTRSAEYYLQRDSLREKIAQSGFKRVKKDHSYEVRLKQMFHIIDP